MANILQDDDFSEDVEDVGAVEDTADYQFDLTFYGADYPVDSLVKRLFNQDIVVPSFDPANDLVLDVEAFQRKFVWKKYQCDRFVESLLLGLPVPGIFLVQQSNKRLLVLDGQQRLLTLAAFYGGLLHKKEFALEHVQSQFKGGTYKSLDEQSRRTLDDAIIHATVIRKSKNAQDLTSIYSLFERLNSGGTQLSPHEIRVALVPGPLMHLVRDLNSWPAWRALYGPTSKTLKDQELILRFLAMLFSRDSYKSPMKDFLTGYAQSNVMLDVQSSGLVQRSFCDSADIAAKALGKKAFRIKTALNAAIFDSVMVGLATRLLSGKAISESAVVHAYAILMADASYLAAIEKATAREDQVAQRMALACKVFEAA